MTNPKTICGFPVAREELRSFDGGDAAEVDVLSPDRYRFFDVPSNHKRIPRGAGLSYCGASFGEGSVSVQHGAFNRILAFDSGTGEVEVEAGIDLLTLFRFLAARGYYLPCHPGHGAITVGGCIAADVHGKNHARDGTFVHQVLLLSVMHPSHGILELGPAKNPELFHLTCGGYGMTGHILKARLKPAPLPSKSVVRSILKTDNFAETLDALALAQEQSDFAYSWHDMSRAGPGFGAGLVHSGRIEAKSDAPKSMKVKADDLHHALTRRLPGNGVLNSLTAPMLNRIYKAKQKWEMRDPRTSVEKAVFPIHGAESYFALYGRGGFHETQFIIPVDRVAEVSEFLEASVKKNKVVISLASAKIFDNAQSLLRFSGKGICLALNLPRRGLAEQFLNDLDAVVVRCKGRPNLIKDSRLPLHVVEACYPEIERFRSELLAFDPQRIFASALSNRLKL